MEDTPFYDPFMSSEDNLEHGPFGEFAVGREVPRGEPRFEFLGQKLAYPFGIPAGPLLDSKFVRAAFGAGFDVNVYKTVRSAAFPCHPFPNVLAVHVEGDLTPEKASQALRADTDYREPLSITNSFGVPSRAPEAWVRDAKEANDSARPGQAMVMSFMGTVREGQTPDEFVADFVSAARLAKETGAPILEANLSCPNIGNEGLVCYNLDMTEMIAKALREVLGDTPLVLKVGYYTSDDDVRRLADICSRFGDAIAAINTIPAPIVNADGEQALPGKMRAKSGVCGEAIRWAGLEMTERLAKARAEVRGDFAIVGVGGVMRPEDFRRYRDSGADVVMSATGAMWNPRLAEDIQATYPNG